MALWRLPAPARAAVLLLALAVFLCLTLPMASGDTGGGAQVAAMVCCFVLAIVLSVFFLARPRAGLLLWSAPIRQRPVLARGDPPVRAPDLSILGALLI